VALPSFVFLPFISHIIYSPTITVGSSSKRSDITPDSLRRYLNLKKEQPDNEAKLGVARYQAITDLVNKSKFYLDTEDSARALRTSSLGGKLFHFDPRFAIIKKNALRSYISISNDLISNSTTSCEEIIERRRFILDIAPDAIKRIRRRKKLCKRVSFKKKRYIAFKPLKYLNKLPPRRHDQLERKHKVDLAKDFEYALHMKNYYPLNEVLYTSLYFLGSVWFELLDHNIKIEDGMVNISGRLEQNFVRPHGTSPRDYCNTMKRLLSFEKARSKVSCRIKDYEQYDSKENSIKFNVSSKVKRSFFKYAGVGMYYMPRVFSYDIILHFHNGKKIVIKRLMKLFGGNNDEFVYIHAKGFRGHQGNSYHAWILNQIKSRYHYAKLNRSEKRKYKNILNRYKFRNGRLEQYSLVIKGVYDGTTGHHYEINNIPKSVVKNLKKISIKLNISDTISFFKTIDRV